jgi:O-antigen ligase
MIVAFFGMFIALSSMTSLRGEAAVGAIDAGLIFFAGLSIISALVGRKPANSRASRLIANPVFCFVSIGLAAIILSTLLNWSAYGLYFIDPVKAIMPYIATFFCANAMAITIGSPNALLLLRGFLITSLAVGVVYIGGFLIGFGPFFYGPRFSGLSLNPNQTAIFALCGTIIALALIVKSPPSKLKPVYFSALAVNMVLGVITKSDAFMICSVPILFCVAYLIAFKFTRSFLGTALLGAFGSLLVITAVAIVTPDIFRSAVALVNGSLSTGNQDSDRQLLWQNGIAAWQYRPIFGNGAGAWSGLSPFQAMEAHNSFIDWLSMAGLVGTAPLAYCTLSLLRLNFRQHIVSIMGCIALLAFFMFHFVFRLPPVWLAWMALLAVVFHKEGAVFPSLGLRSRGGTAAAAQTGSV